MLRGVQRLANNATASLSSPGRRGGLGVAKSVNGNYKLGTMKAVYDGGIAKPTMSQPPARDRGKDASDVGHPAWLVRQTLSAGRSRGGIHAILNWSRRTRHMGPTLCAEIAPGDAPVRIEKKSCVSSGAARPSFESEAPPPLKLVDRLVRARDRVIATFLPAAYPLSVAPGYMPYTQWSFAHAVAGTVTGVLSMQCLLHAIGLGAGSIPMAAALNWIIKDGLGQLGGVIYASLMSERFDFEPKRLRFTATVTMQASSLLEMLTPLMPQYFLLMASIANIGKNISWLASSATRAQINQTFARQDNLGDITAKAGSQTTAASVIGTGLGILVTSMMGGESVTAAIVTFVPFSALTLWTLARSHLHVATPTLNAQRLDLLLLHEQGELAAPAASSSIPTPQAIGVREQFVWPYRPRVLVNPPLTALAAAVDPPAQAAQGGYSSKATAAPGAAGRVRRAMRDLGDAGAYIAAPGAIWVAEGSAPETALRGYIVASLMARKERPGAYNGGDGGAPLDADIDRVIAAMSDAGWHTSRVYLGQDTDAMTLEKAKPPH